MAGTVSISFMDVNKDGCDEALHTRIIQCESLRRTFKRVYFDILVGYFRLVPKRFELPKMVVLRAVWAKGSLYGMRPGGGPVGQRVSDGHSLPPVWIEGMVF